jgi:hypothetical protein
MLRLINFVPLVLLFLALYVEFSNIVMGRWFWLLLAIMATAFAGYKLVRLMPDDRTEVSEDTPKKARTIEVVFFLIEVILFLFGAFVAVLMWWSVAIA